MKNIFKIQNLPYLLSLLVFLFGWSLNRVIETIYSSPTLEYSMELSKDAKGNSIQTVIITNISNTTLFKDVDFNFESPSDKRGSKIVSYTVFAVSNSYRGNLEKKGGTYHADFIIPEIHPMSSYEMKLKYTGAPPEMSYNSPTQAIFLKESSTITWAVKNELLINWLLIAVWAVLIGVYIIFMSSNPKTNPDA